MVRTSEEYDMNTNELYGFSVLDLDTGETADLKSIQEESWLEEKITGELTGFLIGSDRRLYITDENGNLAECNQDRFKICIETVSDMEKSFSSLLLKIKGELNYKRWDNAISYVDQLNRTIKKLAELNEISKKQEFLMNEKERKEKEHIDW